MKTYHTYHLDDFIQDLRFREWVLLPSPEETAFWESYITENPSQKEDILKAIDLIKKFEIKDIHIDSQKVSNGIAIINERIDARKNVFFRPVWLKIAASIALILGIGFAWLQLQKSSDGVGEVAIAEEVVMENIVNPDDKPLSITLPDGSTVLLEKNSEITYSKDFTATNREINLKGEALFDVVRDTTRPFLVYAGETTTRVLGTSFIVRAFEGEEEVKVDVLRGKVMVSSRVEKADQKNANTVHEVVLIPNQQAVFHEADGKLVKKLSLDPKIVAPTISSQQFVFDEVRVPKILRTIELAYGVNLVFDREELKNCVLTTKLADETLFQKLDIICKSIGATYRIDGVKIIIEGSECQ